MNCRQDLFRHKNRIFHQLLLHLLLYYCKIQKKKRLLMFQRQVHKNNRHSCIVFCLKKVEIK